MFEDRDRLVFRYQVDDRTVYADPLALRRRLVQATGGEINQLLREAADPPPGGAYDPSQELACLAARERLAAAILAAFDLPPFDPATGGGTTEAVALAPLWEFTDWLEKNGSGGGS